MSGAKVCGLAGCDNPIPEDDPRRYCSAGHRKLARRQRRATTITTTHAPSTKPAGQAAPVRVAAPSAAAVTTAATTTTTATTTVDGGGPDEPEPPTVRIPRASGYRRLVPEPRPGWWRRVARRPFGATVTLPPRTDDALAPLPSHPEWLWPSSYRSEPPARPVPPARTEPTRAVLPGRSYPARPPYPPQPAWPGERRPARSRPQKSATTDPRVAFALVSRAVPTRSSLGVQAGQLREALGAALHSLTNNRLRSLLTAVGIIAGVMSVIVLMAMGNGMRVNFDREFAKLANQVTITPAKGQVPDGGVPQHLTDADVAELSDPRKVPHVTAVSPAMVATVVTAAGQRKAKATLIGATENYLEMIDRKITAGSWLTAKQIENDERVVVLGEEAINLLYGSSYPSEKVVGQRIRLAQSVFRVVGVLKPDGQNDNAAIVPFGTSRAYLVGNENGKVDQVILKSTDARTVDALAAEATAVLDAQHRVRTPSGRDFNVKTFTELLRESTRYIDFLAIFIVAVGAISLFVGGVGVANIMLVSVTERTREIGIRKAVGATTTAIMRQFLSEAVLLTALGGLVGVVFGIGLAKLGESVMLGIDEELPVPMLTWQPVLVAFGVSLLIGLLAGGYPARRAALMRPIQALRFE
ncbi:hypothetical protein GCM10023321_74650 [Pseudonocardia eucalypti]|uniref:ABC transport system permease protein n=1 Tax=Pseudonocardia eucalypti TaxID=648755 RepID=A0ABP9R943_9PSEU|nr:ABC-type antimicrobial peptide transport system permease subunit [Pseudonocardia eucalypti]